MIDCQNRFSCAALAVGATGCLWEELKGKCRSAKLEFGEESRTADRRWIRVDKRTMLITSWRRVLDALQETAAARGLSAIEQEIVQLRSLAGR